MATEDEVIEYLQANRGMRFTLGQLARHFNMFPMTLKPQVDHLIDKGLASMNMEGVTKKYFVMTELEEQFHVKREMDISFKPLSDEYMKAIRWAMSKRTA